jgi:hypothetical protein
MRAMRPVLSLVVMAGLLSACAPLPPLPPRPDFRAHPGIKDEADKLQVYYNYRLTPASDGGYRYGQLRIPMARLDEFMLHQGDPVAEAWARKGDRMVYGGWGLALALQTAAVVIAAQAPEGDPARNAWWAGILPSALLGWTFHWIGDNWFRKPAVAHYDRQLKRELGLTRD